MRTIHKFPFEIKDEIHLQMPHGARAIAVQEQFGVLCFWVAVDTEAELVDHVFKARATGQRLDGTEGRHIGTVQQVRGHIVIHLFEEWLSTGYQVPTSGADGPALEVKEE